MSDLFIDRLENITIAQGIARLDFLRLISFNPDKKEARFDPAMRLAIPIEGLMGMTDMLIKLREELLKQQASQTDSKA